jgi:hypothetical protein
VFFHSASPVDGGSAIIAKDLVALLAVKFRTISLTLATELHLRQLWLLLGRLLRAPSRRLRPGLRLHSR